MGLITNVYHTYVPEGRVDILVRYIFLTSLLLMELFGALSTHRLAKMVLFEWKINHHRWIPHAISHWVGIILTGHAMVLFRLVRGASTFYLKIIHMLMQLGPIIFIGFGYKTMCQEAWDNNENTFSSKNFHVTCGNVLSAMYIIQSIVGFVVFVCIPSQKVRRIFSGFHNLFGILILLFETIIHFDYIYIHSILRNQQTPTDMDGLFVGFFSLSFTILCLAIVVFPQFEWGLVGEL